MAARKKPLTPAPRPARGERERRPRRGARVRGASKDETYRTLAIELRNGVALVALDRPDVHNAFDDV